jgi:hypothetical protein
MEHLIDELLSGLTYTQFIAAFIFGMLGLSLNMLRAAITRLSTKRVRKVNYKVFACRAASSLVAVFVIIVLCKDLFGVVISKPIAFSSGLVVDIAIQFLITFATNIFSNAQNNNDMNLTDEQPQELEYVFSFRHPGTLIKHGENFISAAEYAKLTGGIVETTSDGTTELIYFHEPAASLEVSIDGVVGFVGHVPRPRKPR